jgi:hypothetical protein
MKKLLTPILCLLFLNTQTVAASSWPSISPKRIKDVVAVASGILSIPCFKTCYDVCQESDSLLRSILPNFDTLISSFEAECDRHLSHGYPSGAQMRLWNKFLKTNVEPICPELLPRFHALDLKSTAYCLAGTFLLSVAVFCILDNYVPKKSKASEIN